MVSAFARKNLRDLESIQFGQGVYVAQIHNAHCDAQQIEEQGTHAKCHVPLLHLQKLRVRQGETDG